VSEWTEEDQMAEAIKLSMQPQPNEEEIMSTELSGTFTDDEEFTDAFGKDSTFW
jgi:hypothetical protein